MTQDTHARPRTPDILEVIANLSSNEVFTPPRIANAVLDLLPVEVWTDKTLRWLDPGSKTGVFPREITRRLMMGLKDTIPDDAERLQHILTNQVFAIAITSMTAMMSRRSLYCSKDASSEFSAVRLASADGNVWHQRIEHRFDARGRCSECGGIRDQLEQPGRDNFAYAFIHAAGQQALAKEFSMKFDVVVGNPPYQMDAEAGNRTVPIYNAFVDIAKGLAPRYITMIIPSRWMAGGLGLHQFRQEMLADRRIRELVDYHNAAEVFPTVGINGGVCYFLWDREYDGMCNVTSVRAGEVVGPDSRNLNEFDVLVRDNRALGILRKVLSLNEPSVNTILARDKEFGWTSNFDGFHDTARRGDVPLHYIRPSKRAVGYIARRNVLKSQHLIDTWKLLVPAVGSGRERERSGSDLVLGPPLIAAPPSVCTQSFLFFYATSEEEIESLRSYYRTRFFRFLVSLRKISQHATHSTYRWVPLQTWDRTWTDADLYEKYAVAEEEQAYIASVIKEMPV